MRGEGAWTEADEERVFGSREVRVEAADVAVDLRMSWWCELPGLFECSESEGEGVRSARSCTYFPPQDAAARPNKTTTPEQDGLTDSYSATASPTLSSPVRTAVLVAFTSCSSNPRESLSSLPSSSSAVASLRAPAR